MDVFNISTLLEKFSEPKIFISTEFETNTQKKESRTIEFFKDLYTYPPKFKIIWDNLDELNTDTFLEKNFGVLKHSLPFIDIVQDVTQRLTNSDFVEAEESRYLARDYIDGYINKSLSENFYRTKTNSIQDSLKNVPVYAVFNGRGEIVLAQTNNFYAGKNLVSEKLYDLCGAFDVRFTKNTGLGLFFMNQNDAEIYLKEIAKSDSFGTKVVGLSVHCIGLDSAYRITRNFTPNTDFRFVPHIGEIQSLLTQQINKDEFIFEDSQQQLRFRRRPVKILPNLTPGIRAFERQFSPFSSFLQKSEYFKGVPIYFVQIRDTPRNFFLERAINLFNISDTIVGKVAKSINTPFGFGHCWVMQGSINSGRKANDVQNYVFFDSSEALDFCRKYGRQIVRFRGNRIGYDEPLINKPKIFVFNLEDFLELWEENIKIDEYSSVSIDSANSSTSIFDASSTYFVPDRISLSSFDNLSASNRSFLSTSKEFVRVKFKTLQGFINVFLNSN